MRTSRDSAQPSSASAEGPASTGTPDMITSSAPAAHTAPETASVTPPDTKPEAEVSGKVPELPVELERNLVQVFKLLSDETRLKILLYLTREDELHVTALCGRLEQSQPAVSHHLSLLKSAGLIEARRDGKHNFYSVRRNFFHGIIQELFQSIAEPFQDEIRFDEFVLTQENPA